MKQTMPAKSYKFKLGNLTVKAVARHMWDSPEDPNVREYDYRTKSLGVFYRRQLAIGTKKKGKAVFSKGNIFPIHVVGLSLLYAKCWLEFSWRVRSYNTPKSIISNTHNQHYGC